MIKAQQSAEYDSPWKEAIALYFPSFIDFFFPQINSAIDWSRGHEFLDKEFQQIVRDTETGRREADKLVKVWLKDGEETWILIHVEVQSQRETIFAERMYIYNSRIYDVYRRSVLSLAVLADEHASWRPNQYQRKVLGCVVSLEFLIVKLLDYSIETLLSSDNPFAIIVNAHRETQATHNNPNSRYREKLRIAKSLYQRGYQKSDILELYRLIDWMMTLPNQLQSGFQREIKDFEEENQMPYVTTIERWARQEGLEQGLEQGIEQGLEQGILQKSREAILEVLEVRFGSVPEELATSLNQIQEDSVLTSLHRQAITVASLEMFQELVNRI
ncbi:MAG: transposase [Symploca sp. SIO2E6]|nr:transposase [Symploca sp. SIO2E6]